MSRRLEEAAAARRRDGVAPAALAVAAPAAPDRGVDAGLPAPCPRCEGPGFLDLIDMRHSRQHEHCVACGTTWVRPV